LARPVLIVADRRKAGAVGEIEGWKRSRRGVIRELSATAPWIGKVCSMSEFVKPKRNSFTILGVMV
jgi:hypothetical protein